MGSARLRASKFPIENLCKWSKYIPIRPTPKQLVFLRREEFEVFYGGAAGGGKSVALLACALQYVDVPGYAALILRRTFKDLSQPNGLMDIAQQWLRNTDAKWDSVNHQWVFPSGAKLKFGYMDTENDKYNHQGAEYQCICWDELTQFTETQYAYLISRCRKTHDLKVPLRIRAASNPGGEGHEWVKKLFVDTLDEERVFIPAGLKDNPYLMSDEYKRNMERALDPVTREQLMNGDWNVRQQGNMLRREWYKYTTYVPGDMKVSIRYWDLSATTAMRSDYTVGAKMSWKDGEYYIEDIIRTQATPGDVENLVRETAERDGVKTLIYMEQEPGSAGVNNISNYARRILQGYAFFADKKTGDKVSRARPFSAAVGNKLVTICNMDANWVSDFIWECEAFPDGVHDDQVDACSGAFHFLNRQVTGGIKTVGTISW